MSCPTSSLLQPSRPRSTKLICLICTPTLGRASYATSPASTLARAHKQQKGPPYAPQPPLDANSTPFSLQTHATYRDSKPPNSAQLTYATQYFTTRPKSLLLSAAKFRILPPSSAPEVAFVGRSNVGKSTLIAALVGTTLGGRKLVRVSGQKGSTQRMNAFSVGEVMRMNKDANGKTVQGMMPLMEDGRAGGVTGDLMMKTKQEQIFEKWEVQGKGGLVVVDMPGYESGRKRAGWGKEVVKYLKQREQLRRTFVLIDSDHGMKGLDEDLLGYMHHYRLSYQIVMSKADKILLSHKQRGYTKTTALQDNLGIRADSLKRFNNACNEVWAEIRPDLRYSVGDQKYRPRTQRSMAMGDLIGVSGTLSWPPGSGKLIGIDALRWSVLQAVGLESDETGRRKELDIDIIK